MTTILDDDIPTLVAEEIKAAHLANIPSPDIPAYVAERIRLRVEGQAQYVRKRGMSPAQRAEDIRARFNGRNLDELAKEHNLTPRRVRQILTAR